MPFTITSSVVLLLLSKNAEILQHTNFLQRAKQAATLSDDDQISNSCTGIKGIILMPSTYIHDLRNRSDIDLTWW